MAEDLEERVGKNSAKLSWFSAVILKCLLSVVVLVAIFIPGLIWHFRSVLSTA